MPRLGVARTISRNTRTPLLTTSSGTYLDTAIRTIRPGTPDPSSLWAHRRGVPRRPRAGFGPLAAAFGGGNRRRTEGTGVLGRSPAGMLAAPWPLAWAGAAGAAAGRRDRGTRVLCSMHVGAAGGLRPSAEIHRGALGRDGGPPDLKVRLALVAAPCFEGPGMSWLGQVQPRGYRAPSRGKNYFWPKKITVVGSDAT